jgi:hypothetical protein
MSMKKTALCASLAAALTYLSGPALAAPITIEGSVADGSLLAGGTTQGAFDATALLPAYYQINSASFRFSFGDDADALTDGSPLVAGSRFGSYNYGGGNGTYVYSYYRDVTQVQSVQRTGEQEGASLSLGGLAAGSGATSSTQSSMDATVYQGMSLDSSYYYPGYSYSCGNHSTCWNPGYSYSYYSNNYTQTFYNTQDWTGGFEISGTITDKSLLDQLLNNSRLDFGLSVYGDLYLTRSQLSLDVTEIAAPSGDVPEPSSLSLALLALGALGYTLRRRGGGAS